MVLGLVVIVACLWPRSAYQDMSSQGYEITIALYAACNAESEDRVAEIESMVSARLNDQQIDEREAEWFQEVFEFAKEGDWRRAAIQSREILAAQTNAPRS